MRINVTEVERELLLKHRAENKAWNDALSEAIAAVGTCLDRGAPLYKEIVAAINRKAR
jgi:hypothetical protein